MSVSPEEVRRIARLAQLAIPAEAVDSIQGDINNILRLAGEMNPHETKDVLPMAHSLDLYQRLREDIVTEGDESAAAMALAPASEAHLYLVPEVLSTQD